MIEPTEQNLIMYEEWILKGDQNETFFGDIVEKCCRIELNEGQTFIIPSGSSLLIFFVCVDCPILLKSA